MERTGTGQLSRERVAELDLFKRDLQVNNFETVDCKLRSGRFNVNEPFPFPRWTPLMVAAYAGHANLVELLLSYGADPNAEIDRYTVLHAAVAAQVNDQETEKTVRFLLEAGADVNALGCLQMTALSYAAKANKVQTMSTLLEFGAAINAQCARGYTALMYAATNGHAHATELLVKRGADPEISALSNSSSDTQLVDGTTNGKSDYEFPPNRRVALHLVGERLTNQNLSDTARERLIEARRVLQRVTNRFNDMEAWKNVRNTCTDPQTSQLQGPAKSGSKAPSTVNCDSADLKTRESDPSSDADARAVACQLQRANAFESQRRLAGFLNELNLAHLRALTDGRRVTFAALLSSDDAQLRDQFGIVDAAERRKLLTAIENVHEAAFADDSLPFAARIRRFVMERNRARSSRHTSDANGAGVSDGANASADASTSASTLRRPGSLKLSQDMELEKCEIETALSANDLLGVVRNVLVHAELLDSAMRFVEHQISTGICPNATQNGANDSKVPVFVTQRHDDLTLALLGEALRLTIINTNSLRNSAEKVSAAFTQLRSTFDLRSPDLLKSIANPGADDCLYAKKCSVAGFRRRIFQHATSILCALSVPICLAAVVYYRPTRSDLAWLPRALCRGLSS